MQKMNLVTLQTKVNKEFDKNLNNLKRLINSCKEKSFILAPELVLSAYSYEDMEKANIISLKALEELPKLSKNKTIALTLTIKEKNNFYNRFYLFHNSKIIHTQEKFRLFELGNETKYFTKGKEEDIKIFEVEGLKVGVLICFELRFTQYWQKLLGCDIILVPAMWGANRKSHFETLCKALAITNQCYVIASNSAQENCCKSSAIIDAFGEEIKDDSKELLSITFDKNITKKMRKYIKIGIPNE